MTTTVRNAEAEADARSGVQQATEMARQAAGQVQEKVQEVADQVQTQAKSAAASRKDQMVEELGGVAQAFRVTSQELHNQDKGAVAQYANKVADQVDRVSSYLEERDVTQLLEDAESFARRQPELFLGGAFIAGLLVGRFIKSSGERRMARREPEMSYRSYGYTEDYTPGSTTFDRSDDPYRTYSSASDTGFPTPE